VRRGARAAACVDPNSGLRHKWQRSTAGYQSQSSRRRQAANDGPPVQPPHVTHHGRRLALRAYRISTQDQPLTGRDLLIRSPPTRNTSRVRHPVVALLLAIALGAAFSAPAAAATIVRIKVDAFAEANFGCPAFFSPAGTICHETHVQLYREADAFEGGPVPPRRWQIFVERYRIEFISDDPNVPPLGPFEYASGTLDDPAAIFDEQHLATASVQAAVPLSDGTTAKLNIVWAPTTDLLVFGNDGPFLAGANLRRHFGDRCVTVNNNAHQKLRFGITTGTADGVPFHSYTDFPFSEWMGTAQYLLLTTTHGNCA
jgi:hypothetical protein